MNRIIITVLLFTSVAGAAEDAYTAVASFFAEYDKALENLAVKAQRVTSLSATEKMFVNEMGEHDCATYFLRTNSKGKIIAKVSEEGIAPRDYRYIGKQKWFEVISLTNKPYYGYTKNRSGYYLFWNKPIHVKKKSGIRFGGSISAKINMKKSFQKIADTKSVNYTIKLGKKTLFSNLSGTSEGVVTKPLSIGGLPVITISYVPIGGDYYYPGGDSETVHKVELEEPTEETTEPITTVSSAPTEMHKSVETTEGAGDEIESKVEKSNSEEKGDGENRSFPLIPFIFFFSIFIGLVIAVSKLIAHHRHEKLLQSLEDDN